MSFFIEFALGRTFFLADHAPEGSRAQGHEARQLPDGLGKDVANGLSHRLWALQNLHGPKHWETLCAEGKTYQRPGGHRPVLLNQITPRTTAQSP
jgi:hypothetical protein